MMYEEYFPDKISYSTYERDLNERDSEITQLQALIYKKEEKIEELEELIREIKNEKNIKLVYSNQKRIRRTSVNRKSN